MWVKDSSVLLDRRRFIATVVALGLSACAAWRPSPEAGASATPMPDRAWANAAPWPTLAAVCAHLLPSAVATPGAEAFHALDYLHNSLSDRRADASDWDRLVAGTGQLQQLAQTQQGAVFEQLDSAQRESVLRALEADASGQLWLSLLLTYLLEALLADPVYGGNADASGWQWLQHQPGFPRPPADHAWYRMAAVTGQRRQKAVG